MRFSKISSWFLRLRATIDRFFRSSRHGSLYRTVGESLRSWFPPHSLGERGERAAERYLRRLGYQILERRVRGQFGELDLVALDRSTVVFVEVKTRRTHGKGHPAAAVDARKQRKLTKLALVWLKRHRLLNHPARFDVVAVTWPDDRRQPTIEHYRNAFEAVGRWQMFS